jgi:hypothetical protein
MKNPIPHHVNERESDMRGIKDGWYEVSERGKLGSGPFSNRGDCMEHILRQRAAIVAYQQWAAS